MENQAEKSLSIAREKIRYGTFYGALAGVALAAGMWGWDELLLSQAHVYLPWLKLILGVFLCGLAGGVTGWLVMRKESGLYSFLFWLAAAILLAWITVGIPLQLMPAVYKFLNPGVAGYIQYGIGTGYMTRLGVALVWLLIFVTIAGMLQLTLVDSAVFSTSMFGRFAPFIVCVVLLAVSGTILDDLVNAPFRGAIFAIDAPIQFILDHQGKTVDPALARNARAGSLRGVRDLVTEDRRLVVSSYEDSFVQIHVLVRFEDAWVDCISVYSHAAFCQLPNGE